MPPTTTYRVDELGDIIVNDGDNDTLYQITYTQGVWIVYEWYPHDKGHSCREVYNNVM